MAAFGEEAGKYKEKMRKVDGENSIYRANAKKLKRSLLANTAELYWMKMDKYSSRVEQRITCLVTITVVVKA